MVKVMKKDNAIIRATDEMALELQLQGYVEVSAAKSESDSIAKQPNPYDEEEVKLVKESVEDNAHKIVADGEEGQDKEEDEKATAKGAKKA